MAKKKTNKPASKAPPTPKRRPGRPTTKTPEVCQRLFDEIARCRPVYEICDDDGMPSESSVYKWDREDPEFSRNFAYARARAGNRCGWRIVRVGEDVLAGKIPPDVGRVAAYCFLTAAQRLSPKDWGDKVELEHTGTVTETRRVVLSFEGLTDEQQRVAMALAAGPKRLPTVETTARERDPGYTPTAFEEVEHQEPDG